MTLRVRVTKELGRASLALMLLSSSGIALAAESESEETRAWEATVGAGAVHLPEYLGSDEYETLGMPLVNVRYKNLFLGGAPGSGAPAGLGMYLYDGPALRLGLVVSGDARDPREESDDARLRGLGDIDAAAQAGMFASYSLGWLTLSANTLTDVSDQQQGTIANFDVEVTYPLTSTLILSAGPGVTWANRENTQTFFGVTAAQAARSAFGVYTPDSGVSLVRFSVGLQYLLTEQWFLGVNVTAAQLQGDAADSPIVVDENQNLYALFVGYRL